MGTSPVACSVWLYTVFTVPLGNAEVVIAGAVPVLLAGAIVIDRFFSSFPVAFVAVTFTLDVPAVVGVPAITPVVALRVKPEGNAPVTLHVMGLSPVAASVWLYAVFTVPLGNDAVVIVGAVPVPPPPVASLPLSQAAKENPITAARAITPNTLNTFFILKSPYGNSAIKKIVCHE
jgi:hypothetical protein